MDEVEKEVNRKTWRIMGIIVLLLIAGSAGYYFWYLKATHDKEIDNLLKYQQEKLIEEYEDLSRTYQEFEINISNDSLLAELATSRAQVQRLQEEVKTIKATNVRRINELTKELETMRTITRHYIVQVDSLNAENAKLKDENKQVTKQYQTVRSTVTRLEKQNEQLTATVQRAARLDAVSIQPTLLNSKGKAAKTLKQAAQIQLTFVIAKNETAQGGEQTIFVCLIKPDDNILTKPNTGTFPYENKSIPYSMKRIIEYDGQEQPVVLYWDIEEFLSPGTYRADIFAEGNLIGRKSFHLD